MSVQVSELPGGLRIVTHRMETVETVSLGVWVHVGTRFEAAEANGVSHLLEHMAFKGTERRDARAIAEEIEAVGGHLNAYTSREITAYHATVLKEDVALGIDIITDILQNPVFDETELGRERAVVLQEIGQTQDTPDDIVFDRFQETAFPGQPMGWPVLGPPEIVAAMPGEVLRAYMKTHYTAPRMVVSAAGNLDHDAVVRMVEQGFSALGTGNEAAVPKPARYAGGDQREQRELEQVHLLIGFEGFAYGDDDYYAAQVMSVLLGGGMSSRLFQEIRETRGLAYSIYSFNSAYVDSGLFGIYSGTGEEEVAELVPALCHEVVRAASGIEEPELLRARAQLRAGLLMSLESTGARAEQLARQLLVMGRPLPLEEIIGNIEAVDVAAVERTIRRILASRPTVTAIGPLGSLEGFDDVAARLDPGSSPG
jgi:predicted Zn-dependent peptidase